MKTKKKDRGWLMPFYIIGGVTAYLILLWALEQRAPKTPVIVSVVQTLEETCTE